MSYPPAQLGSANYTKTSATNATAVITLTGVAGYYWCLSGISWSYSGTPTGGNITITDNGATVYTQDVTTSGAGFIPFNPSLMCSLSNTMVITLAAGGTGVIGKINALGVYNRAQ